MLDKIESIEKQVQENPAFQAAEKQFFIPKVVEWLSDGFLFRTVISLALKAGALYFIFQSLWGAGEGSSWIHTWKDIGDMPSKVLPSAILTQIAFLVMIYAVAHLLYNRANKIQGLQPGPFTAIPILVIFIRLMGEIMAVSLLIMGLTGSLCLLISGGDAMYLTSVDAIQSSGEIYEMYPIIGEGLAEVGSMSGEGRFSWFLHGIKATFVGSIATAFFFYMVAEFVNLLTSMAQNLSRMAGSNDA